MKRDEIAMSTFTSETNSKRKVLCRRHSWPSPPPPRQVRRTSSQSGSCSAPPSPVSLRSSLRSPPNRWIVSRTPSIPPISTTTSLGSAVEGPTWCRVRCLLAVLAATAIFWLILTVTVALINYQKVVAHEHRPWSTNRGRPLVPYSLRRPVTTLPTKYVMLEKLMQPQPSGFAKPLSRGRVPPARPPPLASRKRQR